MEAGQLSRELAVQPLMLDRLTRYTPTRSLGCWGPSVPDKLSTAPDLRVRDSSHAVSQFSSSAAALTLCAGEGPAERITGEPRRGRWRPAGSLLPGLCTAPAPPANTG